jgi:hypothetical protein
LAAAGALANATCCTETTSPRAASTPAAVSTAFVSAGMSARAPRSTSTETDSLLTAPGATRVRVTVLLTPKSVFVLRRS